MIAGNNPSDSLKQRIESIENQLAKTTSSYDQKQLKNVWVNYQMAWQQLKLAQQLKVN